MSDTQAARSTYVYKAVRRYDVRSSVAEDGGERMGQVRPLDESASLLHPIPEHLGLVAYTARLSSLISAIGIAGA